MAAVEERRLEFGDESRPRLPAVGAAVAADAEGESFEGEFNLAGGGMTPRHGLLRQRPAAPEAGHRFPAEQAPPPVPESLHACSGRQVVGGSGQRRDAEPLERLVVGSHGLAKCCVLVVRQAVLQRRLLHDFADGGIVNAAHLREEVVLHLEVQSADIPAQQLVFRPEVGGGLHLVLHPRRSHGSGGVRRRIGDVFHHVRQLEDHAENGAGHQVHHHEADGELPPGDVDNEERNEDGPAVVEGLPDKEAGDFLAAGSSGPRNGPMSFWRKYL